MALNLHVLGMDGFEIWVRGLEAYTVIRAEQAFERCRSIVEHRNRYFPVVHSVSWFHNHQITVTDMIADHAVTADAERVGIGC